ncbi:zinc ribbon domain-containing protein [Methanogenium sp. S4BF]|uniref:zinc ribbon domain-containing protein n=1 Tax=Methanogenium sp. S4BF TaxID=1789226 RepID=UPI00241680E6|nr:zinc ribbon domain-containing protein [Methanogenium sp. S4BF]WFN34305.1 zinc ribbon domain-containing protein [Methanogenium sp. S4BF]
MFCPNCGANVPGGFDICPECGTDISARRSHGGGGNEPFIVAEDEGEMHAPAGPSLSVSGDAENTNRDAIIEAEEDEIPEFDELPVEDNLQKKVMDRFPTLSSTDSAGRNISEGVSGSDRRTGSPGGDGGGDAGLSPDAKYSENGRGQAPRYSTSSDSDIPLSGPSTDLPGTKTSDGAGQKPRSAESYPWAEKPSKSRKRPLVAGLAVIILVVLALSLLVYGLPGQGSANGGLPVPTPLPTPLSDETPVPVTETAPPWTPSDNLVLSVSAYGGGYKVEIDGGIKANEVAKIALTVEDSGGLHTMEWVYPSRRESFFMARDAYNGTASATEHVTATATFTDGKKEVVFSGDL